ncbi:NAD(P)-binding protein, partial [Chloroflexota bacterium]
MTIKTGVYICHCGSNIAGTVDVVKLAEYAAGLESVAVARHHLYMCSDQGQEVIKRDIKELGLNRVVVASCSPRMHEPTFRRAVRDAGLNPYLYTQVNIREHCSWVHEDSDLATEKAKDLVRAGVRRVYHQEPLEIKEAPVNPNVLVVGGGIAGISAALKIADSEHQVYLVEKDPSVGGHMAQLDKTFPTLDCSACILTPKMTDTGQHPFINLMSYSEVTEVSGYIGNFKARIRRKARYVDEVKCTGCGDCYKVCPVSMDSEFDEGLGKRHAIYTPFPYAVPNKATIDKRGLPSCRVTCPAGVNAQGYIALISQGKFKEALELVRLTMPFAGVIGRVCTHPCEVDCERQQVDEPMTIRALKRFIADYELAAGREKAAPVELTSTDKVAIIGSGPAGLACAYDLIRKGYPVTVFETMPLAGGLLRYGIPGYRLPPKVLDNEINYLEELGVEIKTDTPIKDLAPLDKQGYRAMFLGTGAWVSQKLDISNEDASDVLHALEFLKQVTSGANISLG